jgi:hypothetical protein
MQKDPKARDVFDSLVQITVGNGRKLLFCRDRWIDGRSTTDIAPLVVKKVKTRAKNARTVAQGLHDDLWTRDIVGTISQAEAHECFLLWNAVHEVQLDEGTEDRFSWP